MVILKKNTNKKVSKNVEEGGTSYTVHGNVNRCSHCGKQYGSVSKTKNKTIMRPSDFTPGYISEKRKKETNLKRFMHLNVHKQHYLQLLFTMKIIVQLVTMEAT